MEFQLRSVVLPCGDSASELVENPELIDMTDIVFMLIAHFAKLFNKYNKKVIYVARIWIGYIVDGIEIVAISIDQGGINFESWFVNFLFGAYLLTIVVFVTYITFIECCSKASLSRHWMKIFIIFKLSSFVNALFIFIYPIVISDSHYPFWEIIVMIIAALDMVSIFIILMLTIFVMCKCVRLNKVAPKQTNRNIPKSTNKKKSTTVVKGKK